MDCDVKPENVFAPATPGVVSVLNNTLSPLVANELSAEYHAFKLVTSALAYVPAVVQVNPVNEALAVVTPN